MEPSETLGMIAGLQEIVSIRDGEEYIKDETDTFHLEKRNTWSLNSLASTLQGNESDETDQSNAGDDRIIDYNTVVKRIVVHEKDYPASKETPYFNHNAFYANLKHYQEKLKEDNNHFGNYMLYGEVVTSTNSLLEKYALLGPLSSLHNGFLIGQLGTLKCFDVFLLASPPQQQCKLRDEAEAQTSGCPLLALSCSQPASDTPWLLPRSLQ